MVMNRVWVFAGTTTAVLAVAVAGQTFVYGSARASVRNRLAAAVPAQGVAERLAGAIRIPTVSTEDAIEVDAGAFAALHGYLQREFPLVHARLRREQVGGDSLLYTWPGHDIGLNPVLFAEHLDVVPVEPGTDAAWRYGAFDGAIAGGFIWGRGAIDNKATVLGTLEAVEQLLAEGFAPQRTIYLAFGHDEEVGGGAGARAIADLLASRGVRLDAVLDEGGVIVDGVFPGVNRPVALVGVAEKGFLTVELTTRVPGGHSSLPPADTAIGIVSAAVARVEDAQMSPRLDGPTRALFATIGREFPLLQRALFANLWLTRPLVTRLLQASPTTNAMIRTTTAPTILQAGTKDNVLPSQARAVINFRILPGDSVASVLAHVKEVVDDHRVEVSVGGRFTAEPSPVSPTGSGAFGLLERSIALVAPDAVVAPYLVVVVTDARYYAALSDHVFRFLPLRLGAADLPRMHGTDERVGVSDYAAAIQLYGELMKAWAQGAILD